MLRIVLWDLAYGFPVWVGAPTKLFFGTKDIVSGKLLVLDLTYSSSLVRIPHLLRENADDLVDFEGASQPRIQCDKPWADISVTSEENTSYNIMVEIFCLTSTKDFIKAFCVLMASFLEYTKKVEGSLIFVQKFFLNINDKQMTLRKVLKLISSLKKDEVFI